MVRQNTVELDTTHTSTFNSIKALFEKPFSGSNQKLYG